MAMKCRTFVDTSILLSGLVELGDASAAAGRILDAVASGSLAKPITAWHCCLEFYSVATRLPGGLRVEPRLAKRLLEEEVFARFTVSDLPRDTRLAFLDAVAAEGVAGGRVYDAHIAEVARLGGATLVVTDNRRHFVSLLRHGIRVLTAREFADEQGL
jgi:predicted nucleic acid-binding protein